MGIKCARTYDWKNNPQISFLALWPVVQQLKILKVNRFSLLGGSDNASLLHIAHENNTEDHSYTERQLWNLSQCSAKKTPNLAVKENYFYT